MAKYHERSRIILMQKIKKGLTFKKTYINKDNLFGIKVSFRVNQMVKMMYGENQIRNWKFKIYTIQSNTKMDRLGCGDAWQQVVPDIWYSLMDKYKYLNMLKNNLKKVPVNQDY